MAPRARVLLCRYGPGFYREQPPLLPASATACPFPRESMYCKTGVGMAPPAAVLVNGLAETGVAIWANTSLGTIMAMRRNAVLVQSRANSLFHPIRVAGCSTFRSVALHSQCRLGKLGRLLYVGVLGQAPLNAAPEGFALYVAVPAVGHYGYGFVVMAREVTLGN
jgi:hypothetical protein